MYSINYPIISVNSLYLLFILNCLLFLIVFNLRLKSFRSFSINSQVALWIVLFSFVIYLSLILYGWPIAIFRSLFIIACHLTIFYSCYSWLVPQYFENKKYLAAFGGLGILLIIITILRFFVERQFVPLSNGLNSSLVANRNGIGFILLLVCSDWLLTARRQKKK
jgi:hypothetical protein